MTEESSGCREAATSSSAVVPVASVRCASVVAPPPPPTTIHRPSASDKVVTPPPPPPERPPAPPPPKPPGAAPALAPAVPPRVPTATVSVSPPLTSTLTETPLPLPPATPLPSGRKIEPPCAPHASTRRKLTSVGTTHDSSPPVASNRHLTRASSKGRLQPPDGNPLLVGVAEAAGAVDTDHAAATSDAPSAPASRRPMTNSLPVRFPETRKRSGGRASGTCPTRPRSILAAPCDPPGPRAAAALLRARAVGVDDESRRMRELWRHLGVREDAIAVPGATPGIYLIATDD